MEFEHVGSHCSLPSCKQKDFLPFTCDSCHQPFCLAHRSYDAHGCDGALKKDITSLDCPICGKSFKFDKSKDPNEIWEEHYSLYCTRKSANPSNQVQKCARPDCRTHLGPSNTLQCPKCHKKVCLSHRMEEEHDCVANRQKWAKPVQPKPVNSSSNKLTAAPVKQQASSNPREAFLSRFEAKNPPTSKQSHHVQKKPRTTNSSSTNSTTISTSRGGAQPSNQQSFLCPMCSVDCGSLENLSRHVENHLMNDSSIPAPSPSTSISNSRTIPVVPPSPSTGFERCPVCNQQFSDPVELLNHVEQQHSGTDQGTSSSKPSQSDNSCTVA